jgi:hypothetical protein
MGKLGISIYPEHSTSERTWNTLHLHKYGFKRSLPLPVEGDKRRLKRI